MKRLISTFCITIVLGLAFFFFLEQKKEEDIANNESKVTYLFDVQFTEKIEVKEILNILQNEEEVLLFIGDKNSQSSAKMSTFLKEVAEDYSLKVYYLEREEINTKDHFYQDLVNSYGGVKEYIGFTPLLMIFRNNKFVSGYPGDAEYRNLVTFLKYSEVIEENRENE